jgi:hypothetical protein
MTACACLGPHPGDPYCPCDMKNRGLTSAYKSPEPNPESIRNLNEFFAENIKRYKVPSKVIITQ